ncbi:hypothetical protein THIOM_003893 [Candidatus Thiomargarita nelsonii]|uniref:DUF2281 domain-containing protein n=1 Tax=Candidatus Thiomargarita nelsonii TaxID=1003181 RepID=A0A176RXI6_9GAMM|nr:hypothetical protein THIOM_003893 [Candidatus Thiomargarita nelsonii]
MLQTIEAVIDIGGQIRLLEPIKLTKTKRALVTLLNNEDEPMMTGIENALLSEETLGKDWNKAEEDQAWSHLQ